MMLRKMLYAGTWYPEHASQIKAYTVSAAKTQKAVAAICPHAGWQYSGKVAGEVFSNIAPAGLYVLIGPNHRGTGAPVAVYADGAWQTPLGDLAIETAVADAIVRNSAGIAQPDATAHREEHSLEVEVPFIKYFSPDAKIVPVCLADYRPATCKRLGEAIGKAVQDSAYRSSALLVASTDMSHYLPADQARALDMQAIERIQRLDPDGLLRIVAEKDISMCGSGPVAAVLHASRLLGAANARLITYTNSGEITGDTDEVVAYAGIIIS